MKYPTLNDIKKDYAEITDMVLNCKTFSDIYNLKKSKDLDIEINCEPISFEDEYNIDDIESLRVESYGYLDYIYFWNFGNRHEKTNIYFDVWCEDLGDECLMDMTIDTVEENYNKLIKTYKDVLFENLSFETVDKMVELLEDYAELCDDIADANVNVHDYMFMQGRKIVADRVRKFLNEIF